MNRTKSQLIAIVILYLVIGISELNLNIVEWKFDDKFLFGVLSLYFCFIINIVKK